MQIMPWQLLISLSVILMSIARLLQKFLVKERLQYPVAFAIVFQFMIGISLLIFGLITQRLSLPPLKPILFNIFLIGVFFGLANVFVFKSLKELEASKFVIIFATRTFFSISATTLILEEQLSLKYVLGALVVFSGVVLVSYKRGFKLSRAEVYALLAAVLFGVGVTNDRFLVAQFDTFSYTTISFILTGITIVLLQPREVRFIKSFLNYRSIRDLIIFCSCYAAGVFLYLSALKAAPTTSQVVIFSLSGVILTVVFATIFLKETNQLTKKIIAALLTSIGLLLVI